MGAHAPSRSRPSKPDRCGDRVRLLAARGMVIYPGKLSKVDCFRIGTIGRLYPADFETLLSAISDVLAEMGVPVPVTEPV